MHRYRKFTEISFRTCMRNGGWIGGLQSAAAILAVGALLFGCAASRQEHLIWEAFGNQTFPSEWTASGYAPLNNGVYREPAAPGSASEIVVRLTEHRAFGNSEGRPAAAVVLVADPGGSGSFYNLALLQRDGEKWTVTRPVLLGDRIRVTSLSFGENSLRIDMVTHGPGDAMCCPTRKASVRFRIEGGQLRKTLPPEAMPLTGRIWKWLGTKHGDGSKAVPEHPENYTIEFLENGFVRIKADCNSAGGGFTVHQNRITIDLSYSTMAACPPSSLERIFTRDILVADQFYLHKDQLRLKLIDASGSMFFRP